MVIWWQNQSGSKGDEAMNIQLRDVTEENFFECVLMKASDVKGHPLFEKHVASNAISLAQSKVVPGWVPKAIYHEDAMVGFAMYGFEKEHQIYFITRLMIDSKQQGKGYGRAAMQEIVAEMQRQYGCKEVYTSFVPDNEAAKGLYTSLGFADTGRVIGDAEESEPLYVLRLSEK